MKKQHFRMETEPFLGNDSFLIKPSKKSTNKKLFVVLLVVITFSVGLVGGIAIYDRVYGIPFIDQLFHKQPKTPELSFPTGNLTMQMPHIIAHIQENYCPFNDMKGLSSFCNLTINTTKRSANTAKLPVIIGITWDPILGQIKLPFFDLTYDQNKKYISASGINYHVPDQVDIIVKNVTTPNIQSEMFATLDDYLNQIQPNRTNVTSGTLGLSLDMLNLFIKFFDNGVNKAIGVTDIHTNLILSFNNLDNLKIIPFVQHAIDSLPAEYDPILYNMFIQYWGTSVVVSGSSGGIAEQTVMVKDCFGGLNLLDQAPLYFWKDYYPYQYQNFHMDSSFAQYSRGSVYDVYGGDPQFYQPTQWDARVKSMDDMPVLTNVVVRPITDFVQNPTIKSNLQRAIDNYYEIGTTKITQFRESFYGQPKIVHTFYGINTGGQIVGYPNVAIGFPDPGMLLGPNTYGPRPGIPFVEFCGGWDYYPYNCTSPTMLPDSSKCFLDSTGHVVSISSETEWPAVHPIVREGVHVRSGCSASKTLMGPYAGAPGVSEWDFLCCTNCIPSLSNVDHYQEGTFSCNCPPF